MKDSLAWLRYPQSTEWMSAAGRLLQVGVSLVFGRRNQQNFCCCLNVNSNWNSNSGSLP